jgi:DNA-binding response OmpR family regulator
VTSMPDTPASTRVAVVADDLIWASRLVAAVQQAGATSVRMGTDHDVMIAVEEAEMAAASEPEPDALPAITAAIVDLFGHRYDGVEAVRHLRGVGWQVIAVAQHDDQETRTLALDAGASRVFSYNKFFQDGPALVTRFLLQPSADPSSPEEGS